MLKTSSRIFLAFVFAMFTLTSCMEEEMEPNLAFSSNGTAVPDVSVGGDETFYKFELNNGKPVWSDQGKYWLGIVADEKVREVYILAESKHSSWQRVDPQYGVYGKGSFDVDAYLRNGDCGLFNSDKEGLNAFSVGPLVYVTYGGKYATLRVDAGEVFRDSGICGSFPSGISCIDYLPFPKTADFYGEGVFIGVTKDGYVAGSKTIDGEYLVPGIELGTPNSSSDVNYNWRTAGEVTCLDVTGWKSVIFTLKDGSTVTGYAQRGGNEFIKVD